MASVNDEPPEIECSRADSRCSPATGHTGKRGGRQGFSIEFGDRPCGCKRELRSASETRMGRKLVPHGDADAAAHPEPGEDAFGNLPDEPGCPVVRTVDLERGAVLYLKKYCRIFKSDADPAIHPADPPCMSSRVT